MNDAQHIRKDIDFMKWIFKGSAKEYARLIRSCEKQRSSYNCCSGCIFSDIDNLQCDGIEHVIEFQQIEHLENYAAAEDEDYGC